MKGLFTNPDGTDTSDSDARKYLAECQAKGWQVIPMGTDCDSFDYQTGCPGHILRYYCTDCDRTLSSEDEICNCKEGVQ